MALNLGELFGTIGLDASEWDKELFRAQQGLKSFGVAGAALAATAAVAIGAALSKGVADAINVEAGNDKLQASLGLTEGQAARAGDAAGSVYAQNFGASMEDVNLGVESVMSSIKGMRDATQADVEDMTKRMLTLASSMGIDVARAAQVAGQMITSGIAKDGVHAADLLTASLQKVPQNVREDILDAVDEYGPFMNSLGIKGEEAMGLLVQASEKGMYGIDKTGDALKEFGIRATDMSKATSGAYEALGMDQEGMTKKLLAGGDTAKTAFGDIIHGLQEMKDPVAQSQAALALFGTPLEDLSVTEIPNFLGALDPMGDKFDSVAGASDKAMTDIASNAKTGFDGFKRQAEAALITFVQDNIMPSVGQFATFLNTEVGPAITRLGDWITNTALPALGRFGDWFRENLPTIQNWATGVGVILFPLFLRLAISAGVSAAAQVVAWATAAGGAVKTAAIYVAQSYIMIGRFVALSAAATVHAVKTGAVWVAQTIAAGVRMAAAWVVAVAQTVAQWAIMGAQATARALAVSAIWIAQTVATTARVVASWAVTAARVVASFVVMAAGATAQAARIATVWTVQMVSAAAKGAASMAVSAARVVAGWVLMGAQSLIHAARMAAAWFIALGPVGWVIAAVIGLVALIIANWSKVSAFTKQAWEGAVRFVSDAWGKITSGVSNGISNVVSFVSGLPGQILGALGNLGGLLLNAGGQIMDGFLGGLRDGFESVKNFVGGIGDWIAKNKGPKAYDLALLVPAGGWIMEGLETGIRKSLPSLQKTLGGVSATIANGVTGGTVGLTTRGNLPGGPAAAGPGVTNNYYKMDIRDQQDPVATSMDLTRRLAALAS
ncbi:phage tail tape measure protein [Pseudarthrobacter sp. NPDC092439]|uniref:phage tail tape measure protein n=1 Tax=unclassified Pseudarthrobacter TaxID=2647000 RepID=UPI00382874F4